MGRPPSRDDLPGYILETTRHMLIKHGYDNLSMRKIADEMGYSATTIYNYYRNKDGLFYALIDEGLEQLYDAVKEETADSGDEPIARLRSFCRAYINYGLENPEYYEIMFMIHTEPMERYPTESYRRARNKLDILVNILEDGAKDGLFEVGDARVAANTAWAFLHGVVSLLIARRVDVRISEKSFKESAVDQVISSFARAEKVA